MINFLRRLLEFHRRRILVGHVSRIPFRVEFGWILVFFLLAWLASTSLPKQPVENEAARFLIGLSTAFVFFVSLFVHEYAHAVVARREGINVIEILLHPFGGVARLTREPDTPQSEFRIAIAGPIASFLVSIVFLGFYALSFGLETSVLTPVFLLLFLLNLMLGVFNLFPGFPLDGGRVLRAILWRRGMEFADATVLTGKFGQVIAFALVFFGVALIGISADLFTGLWSIIVGIFLLDSATGFIRGVNSFENLKVENVMEMPVIVSPGMSIMECVDKIVPFHKHTIFPVSADRQLYGFLVLADIKKSLPREKWREKTVKDMMRDVLADHFIEAERPVAEARDLLRLNGLGVLGVIDKDGKLVGFLRRGRIRKRG